MFENTLIVRCMDRRGFFHAAMLDDVDEDRRFAAGIEEAKRLCGGVDAIEQADVCDFKGNTLVRLR